MKTPNSKEAMRELRALVGTYLEGSADAARASELLDALDVHPTVTAVESSTPSDPAQEARERSMFGCTGRAIDEVLNGKEPRDVAMYAMGTLSNAQELIERSEYEGQVEWSVTTAHRANTIRQLMNVAKYAIDKAVPR